jgi:hypothetical protein
MWLMSSVAISGDAFDLSLSTTKALTRETCARSERR